MRIRMAITNRAKNPRETEEEPMAHVHIGTPDEVRLAKYYNEHPDEVPIEDDKGGLVREEGESLAAYCTRMQLAHRNNKSLSKCYAETASNYEQAATEALAEIERVTNPELREVSR